MTVALLSASTLLHGLLKIDELEKTMTAYQELESTKYLSDHVETENRRAIEQGTIASELWNLAAFYSVVFVAGFFIFQVAGVSVTDAFQPLVNAFVDWSISS